MKPMNLPATLPLSIVDGVATITFDRPQARNALDVPMLDALLPLLERLAADDTVRAVVLCGAGGQAFSAGGDISGIPVSATDGADALARRIEHWAQSSRVLHTMPKPTLAVLDGVAAGAGMALALACDLRMGTPNARFLTAFARIGISGDFGGSYFLTQLVGPAKARELYWMSEAVDAERALALGLLNWLVPREELDATRGRVLARLLAVPTPTAAHIKANLNLALHADLATILGVEARSVAQLGTSELTRAATREVLGKA
jgi:2-(1,2-epoxy-1,2-dihydrophenyl)acetyl-CoA isomerase